MILQADYHKAVMTLKVPNSGPKPKLPSQDQLFMYMTWLKNWFARSYLAWLFKISRPTITRYLITRTNFCYLSPYFSPLFFKILWPFWGNQEKRIKILKTCFANLTMKDRFIISWTIRFWNSLCFKMFLISFW